jgi:hypothetical protein
VNVIHVHGRGARWQAEGPDYICNNIPAWGGRLPTSRQLNKNEYRHASRQQAEETTTYPPGPLDTGQSSRPLQAVVNNCELRSDSRDTRRNKPCKQPRVVRQQEILQM